MRITATPPSGGKKPGTPTIGTASTSSSAQADVTFTAPTYTGKGGTVTYVATSSPGNITGSSTTSPITVTGLTNGTAYTFTVVAQTSYGVNSDASAASNSVTPIGIYSLDSTFNTSGNWTVPAGKSQIAVYAWGGGGSGAAGASPGSGGRGGYGSSAILVQDFAVTAGTNYVITIGSAGSASTFGNVVNSGYGTTNTSVDANTNASNFVKVLGTAGGSGGTNTGGGAGSNASAIVPNVANLNTETFGGGGGGGGGGVFGSGTARAGGAGGTPNGGTGGNSGTANTNGQSGSAGSQPGGGGGGGGGGGSGVNDNNGGGGGNGGSGRIIIYTK